jgi:hypothetical protein
MLRVRTIDMMELLVLTVGFLMPVPPLKSTEWQRDGKLRSRIVSRAARNISPQR